MRLTVNVPNCPVCGQSQLAKPFPDPADNAWLEQQQGHRGCLQRRAVEDAARKGFGINPSFDNSERKDG